MSASGEVVLEPWDTPAHLMAPWFEKARRERREHYASRPPITVPRTRAIITMVYNEPVFLPIWLRYYSRFFAPGDIYVFDNDTTDGSTDRDGFVRIPVAHDTVDHTWMVRTIEGLQRELLERYDVVVVTDVDEIIAPVPAKGTLGDYLDRFDEQWVNCLGYELLHLRDREPPLRLDRPILDQRRFWFFNGGYDKAAVAMSPVTWRPGFHGREDYRFNPDPDLRLIHLHRMDYDLCLARHRTRRRKAWNELDDRERWATHNRIVDEGEFERWFYEDSGFVGFDTFEMQIEEIQPMWRGLF
jgi:hypothetical protein